MSETQTPTTQLVSAEIIAPSQWAKPLTLEERVTSDLGERDAAIAMAILDRLATSPEPIKDICADIMGKDRNTAGCQFNRWKVRCDPLATLYARARQSRADVIVDEIIDIADTETDPHKAKVRVDARKWAAGKFNRLLYGDDPVIQQTNNTLNMSAGQSEANRSALLAELQQRIDRKAKKNALVDRGGGGSDENFNGGEYNPPLTLD